MLFLRTCAPTRLGAQILRWGFPSVWSYGADTGVVDDGAHAGRMRCTSLTMRALVLSMSRCSFTIRWLIFLTALFEAVALAVLSEAMRAVRLATTLLKRAVRAATRAGECDELQSPAAWFASWFASWTLLDVGTLLDGMLLDDGTLLEVRGLSSARPRPLPLPKAIPPP